MYIYTSIDGLMRLSSTFVVDFAVSANLLHFDRDPLVFSIGALLGHAFWLGLPLFEPPVRQSYNDGP